jgi:hypothetical protein
VAQDNQVNKQVKTIAVIAGGAAVVGVAAIVVSVFSLIKARPTVYGVAIETKPNPCPANPVPVLVSSSGKFVSPDVFNICAGNTVTWQKDVSRGPDFQIHFVDGSPFTQSDFSTNGQNATQPTSPASAPSATYSYYKYQVLVSGVVVADPGGNVWR